MKKKILALCIMLGLLLVLSVPMTALAANSGTQNASTSTATTISIKAQDYSTDVSTITFPQGTIGSTVSNPTNGVGTEVQTFGAAGTAKPVVTLLNGGSVAYNIHITVSTWSVSGVVAEEYYLINNKGAACNDASAITNALTFGVDEDTLVSISPGAGNEKDLYLKIVLGTTAGQTSTSTMTILGESP